MTRTLVETMMEAQVRSSQRVADHGEVLTGEREVNAMLDLVQQETQRIDSRFLEPACGDGNFLAPILERKLAVVERRYATSQVEYERYGVLAVSSIYGIDILPDNVQHCRRRLLGIFTERYSLLYGTKARGRCLQAVRYILERNIVYGDALKMTANGSHEPIVFSEWAMVSHGKFKRRDFAFRDLARPDTDPEPTLFNERSPIVPRDTGDKGFIPEPIKTDYPPVSYWELPNAG